MLPKDKLLKGCTDKEGMKSLIFQAEQVLHSWQPTWSSFIEATLREEALQKLSTLSDLIWIGDGGYPNAERQRILCKRISNQKTSEKEQAPIKGLLISGNFLFDQPSKRDIRGALESIGAQSDQLGDIWIQGDRGAQVLCTPEVSAVLDQSKGNIRDVSFICEEITTDQINFPAQRIPRVFNSVEASCRLDAIASAGFGISRAKVLEKIKKGKLRLNWKPIKQSHKELSIGDRLYLEDRGFVEILSLNLTKRQRWRVEIKRQ